MCGIIGGWWLSPPVNMHELLDQGLAKLRHRGPNDQGCELMSACRGRIALAHTRLSIIDLSAAGHQPMVSDSGRYAIIFNGEIYNYREIRRKLQELGRRFSSESDTEVLLMAWQEWRLGCLKMLEGMFAFVVFDRENQTLTCVRDAFGIKPFFYDLRSDAFVFASEQPALLALRNRRNQADWQRGYDYLVHGDYDSLDRTFIDGVKHLLPGHYLVVDMKAAATPLQECWWKPSTTQSSRLSFKDAAEVVREQFLHNIKLHLRSDVPLGAALSGGIDSSAVVCAMRYIEPSLPINTFSYIASDTNLSEESWVDLVNRFTGAKAHKVVASGSDLATDLDAVIRCQGEPFGSTSIYAQYRVFQLARENDVTVTLDGQGADELLAGYSGYPGHRLLSVLESSGPFAAHQFAKRWSAWPGRSYSNALMQAVGIQLSDGLYGKAGKMLGRDFLPSWLESHLLADAGVIPMQNRIGLAGSTKGRRVVEQLANSLQYRGLPGLLRHGDRNSMQFSVEGRVPFLTIPLAELLLSFPEEYLISNHGETKSVFRAAMRGIVPDVILDRKDKIGFATPEKIWLLGMADTVREWLQASDLVPFMNKTELLKKFDAVVAGKVGFNWQVWRWVNYVRWFEQLGIEA